MGWGGSGGSVHDFGHGFDVYRHVEKKSRQHGNSQDKDQQRQQLQQLATHSAMDGHHMNHHHSFGADGSDHDILTWSWVPITDSPSTIEPTPNDDNHAHDDRNHDVHGDLANGKVNHTHPHDVNRLLDAMDSGQQQSSS